MDRPLIATAPPERLESPRPGERATPASVALLVIAAVALPIALAIGLATSSETLVVASVLAVLGLLVIVARPLWGLIFFVALLFIRPEEMFPALRGTRLALVISLITLVAALVHLFLNREKLVPTPMNGMIVGFGLVAIASTLAYGNTSEAAQDFAKMVILVLLVLNLVKTPERYRAYVTAIIVFVTYLALYSVYRFHSGEALDQAGIARSEATGIFGDPNDLAATIAAGLPLVLVRIRRERGFPRFLYLGLVPAFLYAILLTNSRSGMLATLAVVGGFTLVFTKNRMTAVIAAVMVVGILFVASPGRMTNFDSQESSANERFWYWSDGTAQFLQSPLIGIGYNQFPERNDGRTAHNSFVLCYVELGVLGYFFFIGLIYYGFRRRPRQEGDPDPVPAKDEELGGGRLALLGYLVSSFFLSHTYVPIMFVVLSLPMAAHVAYEGADEPFPLTPKERFADWSRIFGIALASIVFIKMFADANK